MIFKGKQSKQSLTKALVLSLIVIGCFIFYFSFASAEYADCSVYGNCKPAGTLITSGANYSINVNNTDHLEGRDTSQLYNYFKGLFDNVYYPWTNPYNFLNSTSANLLYCKLTGCTMNGNINLNNYNITNATFLNNKNVSQIVTGNMSSESITTTINTTISTTNYSINFFTSSGYGTIPYESGLDFSTGNAFTISAWVYRSPADNYPSIVNQFNGNDGWSFYVAGSSKLNFYNNAYDFVTSADVPVGWSLLSVTNDGNGGYQLCINDNCEARSETQPTNNAGNFIVGYEARLSNTNNKGIDELMIWNRALSSTEIGTLYNSGNGVYGDIANAPFSSNLVVGYHFNEGTGTNVDDITAEDNDMTLTSATWQDGKVAHNITTTANVTTLGAIGLMPYVTATNFISTDNALQWNDATNTLLNIWNTITTLGNSTNRFNINAWNVDAVNITATNICYSNGTNCNITTDNLSGYVPYTGATSNVNLNGKNISNVTKANLINANITKDLIVGNKNQYWNFSTGTYYDEFGSPITVPTMIPISQPDGFTNDNLGLIKRGLWLQGISAFNYPIIYLVDSADTTKQASLYFSSSQVLAFTSTGAISFMSNIITTKDYNTTGQIKIAANNKKLLLGATSQSSIYYDGTNMIINPKEVGSGQLKVLGDLNMWGNTIYNASVNATQSVTGNTTGNITIDSIGSLRLNGNATVYNDLYTQIAAAKLPTSQYPDWSPFTANTNAYTFDIDDYADLGTVEVLHNYKEGKNIELHLHMATNGVDNTDRNVTYVIYYTWAVPNTGTHQFSPEENKTLTFTIPANTLDKSAYYISMGFINGSNMKIGTQIKTRVKRIDSPVGTEPTNAPFLGMVGFHYEIDSLGSNTVNTK